MPLTIERDGAVLQGGDLGSGLPMLFQHGLGGDNGQAAAMFPDRPGLRRLTLDARGHGGSTAGAERPFSIPMFAADALAFANARGLDDFVAAGVSMGAGAALTLAVRYPARISALVLVRPAWMFEAAPPYMSAIRAVAEALRQGPAAEARSTFARSRLGMRLAREAPGNFHALLGFFDAADLRVMADLCDDIAAGDPGVTRHEAEALSIPALVIGCAEDRAHPLAYAVDLARAIPGATLIEVPSRAEGKPAHLRAVQAAIGHFVDRLAERP